MTTIYIVTSGDYSDYSINGVFSTPEKVDLFITNNDQDGSRVMGVETWELDEFEHRTRKTVWWCTMDLKTGEITREGGCSESCEERYTHTDITGNRVRADSTVSPKHARKLAVEKRQEFLRIAPGYFDLPASLTSVPGDHPDPPPKDP